MQTFNNTALGVRHYPLPQVRYFNGRQWLQILQLTRVTDTRGTWVATRRTTWITDSVTYDIIWHTHEYRKLRRYHP